MDACLDEEGTVYRGESKRGCVFVASRDSATKNTPQCLRRCVCLYPGLFPAVLPPEYPTGADGEPVQAVLVVLALSIPWRFESLKV